MRIRRPIIANRQEYGIVDAGRLGRSGLKISVLTFGTMTFGGEAFFSKTGATDVAARGASSISAWMRGST